jgi:hypothetical protein
MTRRNALITTAAGTSALAAQTTKAPSFLELRYYYMRNSRTNQTQRTSEFLAGTYVPAIKRAGAGPVGIFNATIAAESPFALVATSYLSLAAMQTALEKLAADAVYQKAHKAWNSGVEMPYVRMESTLLRCFGAMPAVDPGTPGPSPRTFELRTYESDNEATLQKKIRMFEDAEIDIFRKCGMHPVFFAEAIIGPKLPRLTYMLAYDSLPGRDKAWSTFGSHPDWLKLRATPGLSDPEIVSNISNAILKPGAGSEIR